MSGKRFVCGFCDRVYERSTTLHRHLKESHQNEDLDQFLPKRNSSPAHKLICSTCNESFSYLTTLRRHEKTIHNRITAKSIDLICPFCEKLFKCPSIRQHIMQTHGNNIDEKNIVFQSVEEFKSWKETVERESNQKFVANPSFWSKLTNGSSKISYYCSRSSDRIINKLKGDWTRTPFCPARIQAVKKLDNLIYVRYCKTHSGHENEMDDENARTADRADIDNLQPSHKTFSISPTESGLDSLCIIKKKQAGYFQGVSIGEVIKANNSKEMPNITTLDNLYKALEFKPKPEVEIGKPTGDNKRDKAKIATLGELYQAINTYSAQQPSNNTPNAEAKTAINLASLSPVFEDSGETFTAENFLAKEFISDNLFEDVIIDDNKNESACKDKLVKDSFETSTEGCSGDFSVPIDIDEFIINEYSRPSAEDFTGTWG